MNSPLVYCVIAGFLFGLWPLVARPANLSMGWTSLLLSVGMVGVALTSVNSQIPAVKPLIIGLVAGAINGVGLLAYAKLIGWQGVDLSRVVPMTVVLMSLTTVVGALVLFGEPLTVRKAIGFGFALVAVYMLN